MDLEGRISTDVPSALSGSKGIARAGDVSTRMVCAAAFHEQFAENRRKSIAGTRSAVPRGKRMGVHRMRIFPGPTNREVFKRIAGQRENTVLFRFNKAKMCAFPFRGFARRVCCEEVVMGAKARVGSY